MAVITAVIVENMEYDGYSGLFNNEYTIEPPPYDVIFTAISFSEFISGEVTFTPNVSVPAKRVLSVDKAEGYFGDFYNRIHINPNSIILGTLVDVVTETLYIWNAWLYNSKTLSTIDTEGASGISLIGVSLPVVFTPLQENEYSLQVSLSGAIVIDAVYDFNFALESPQLTITGQRLLVWSYIPLVDGLSENLEWKTDVLKTWDTENRIALRTRPRTKFKYSYLLNENEYTIVKNSSEKWNANTFGVPVWTELYAYGVISSGGYTLTFDTTPYEYYVGGLVFIFDSNSVYQTLEIESMTDGSLTFAYEIRAFTDAKVMPLKKAITLEGTKIKRITPTKVIALSEFLVVNDNLIETPVGAGVNYPQYLDTDVITSKQVILSEFTEQTRYDLEYFDNGSGVVLSEKTHLYPEISQQVTFTGRTPAEKWNNKVWFYSRYGKQKSFWVISWSHDIVPVSNLAVSEGSISCEHIKYELYKTISYIAIILTNGTILYNTITSGSEFSDTVEVLVLENALPYDIDIDEIDRICFMRKMRFDSDNIEINHSNYPYATTKIPVVEVPE